VAAAQLTLARIADQEDRRTEAVTRADQARSAIETGGYRVLYRLFPSQAVPPAARIRAGLLTFAAGDALGLPWEGRPPGEIDPEQITVLPARDGWPCGATSDDTAQLLMVADHLAANGGQVSERGFLAALAWALPAMRGTGPTTRAAVDRYYRTGEIRAADGDTNGALMRILPAGWAIPATKADRRREVVTRLTQVTHGAPVAAAAACAVAAMGSYALEGCTAAELIVVALDEFREVAEQDEAEAVWIQNLQAAANGTWLPGATGVTLAAADTLAAIVHVLDACGEDVEGAMRYAVGLGGDTDTVAAIIGGILGCRTAEVEIEWLDRVMAPDAAELDRLAEDLREVRRASYG
jgi:ADP-ribosylglycohydrolase